MTLLLLNNVFSRLSKETICVSNSPSLHSVEKLSSEYWYIKLNNTFCFGPLCDFVGDIVDRMKVLFLYCRLEDLQSDIFFEAAYSSKVLLTSLML